MNYDFTDICITQNEYSEITASSTEALLATSTVSCYYPIKVQIFYMIDFIFFGIVFALCIIGLKKIFKIEI